MRPLPTGYSKAPTYHGQGDPDGDRRAFFMHPLTTNRPAPCAGTTSENMEETTAILCTDERELQSQVWGTWAHTQGLHLTAYIALCSCGVLCSSMQCWTCRPAHKQCTGPAKPDVCSRLCTCPHNLSTQPVQTSGKVHTLHVAQAGKACSINWCPCTHVARPQLQQYIYQSS